MTEHNINTLLDDFEQFIEVELAAIESKVFNAGYNRGYIKGVRDGVQQLAQSNIENEYYAYLEGVSDAYIRDGHIRLYYNHKTLEFMPAGDQTNTDIDRRAYTDVDIPYGADSDIDWKDGHRDYMTAFDLRNTED